MELSLDDASSALVCLPFPVDETFEAALLRARRDREIAVDLGTVATDVCVNIERPFDDQTTEVEFMPLTEAIESFCYDTLELHHNGYENNEGGNGEFTFDVAAATAGLVHNDVVIDHDTTTHEL